MKLNPPSHDKYVHGNESVAHGLGHYFRYVPVQTRRRTWKIVGVLVAILIVSGIVIVVKVCAMQTKTARGVSSDATKTTTVVTDSTGEATSQTITATSPSMTTEMIIEGTLFLDT